MLLDYLYDLHQLIRSEFLSSGGDDDDEQHRTLHKNPIMHI